MTEPNFGNAVNRRLKQALYSLFAEGEAMQLTHSSFEVMAKQIKEDEKEILTLTYPIGYNANKTTMVGSAEYSKEVLLQKISELANDKLALNGIYQLVTIVEALLGDLVRLVVLKYPNKIGAKRSVKSLEILKCESMEELHFKIASSILNELAYKSPKEFAEESKNLGA